jgi:hypothetical protein
MQSPSPLVRDIPAEPFASLEPGTYVVDADGDPATPLRVTFKVPAAGWTGWIGTAKFSNVGNVGLSVSTVSNLVTDGCRDHAWADPPVGPTVGDLATAMAVLEPFEVTSPSTDVTAYGFSGKHLTWIVPDLPVQKVGNGNPDVFTGCVDGKLKSWVAWIDTAEPGDAFYGYSGPGYSEEFWILDVDGTRLMIAAERSAGSPAEDLAEQQAILDSIRIEP